MTPFKYSDDQKAKIIGCLEAACPRCTWTGSGFKPINHVPKFKKGEILKVFVKEFDLSWAIPELEAIADIYISERDRRNPLSTKAQRSRIAKLSKAIVKELQKVTPGSLGFGISQSESPELTELAYSRELGEKELAALVTTLQNIHDLNSVEYEILGGSNATQTARNCYVERVLQVWVDAVGQIRGGPNSEMIKFMIAACRPVLGPNPTDEALVKFANSLKNGRRKSRRILKIGPHMITLSDD
jgi:hypothetical protein